MEPLVTEPEASLTAVRKTRVFEDVARQIQRLIVEGVLTPGDLLPPERQLAERFHVSRNSVRDAIRALEVVGLVVPRQGEGTVVAEVSPEMFLAPISTLLLRKRRMVGELLEFRKMFEPAVAALAAVRATPDEIGQLAEILDRQRERALRGDSTVQEDSEFHYALACAAGNSVVRGLLDVVMGLLRETRVRSLQVPGRLERSLAGHQRVLEAIRTGDAGAAERAVRQHIEEIEAIVLSQL
jgi:GntR family transcriptional repressor for pyruvate dehydrogenase complex